ncbi:hypothetical protein HYPSUDRAFT_738808 [Hypholoma sublateritium FD-334 SS-4]|uniref:Uncharacterized protein n=1 Tax=Hypholoma sublateritium (strain FD-334 SS-4) TaxID=945553 RepID=A0A0D2NXT1_HYPSF|nr:hypothetical protein HYPSUDRAFT_738808 [Hypholoma sublateritium FD-334 SS-4]
MPCRCWPVSFLIEMPPAPLSVMPPHRAPRHPRVHRHCRTQLHVLRLCLIVYKCIALAGARRVSELFTSCTHSWPFGALPTSNAGTSLHAYRLHRRVGAVVICGRPRACRAPRRYLCGPSLKYNPRRDPARTRLPTHPDQLCGSLTSVSISPPPSLLWFLVFWTKYLPPCAGPTYG